jgi:hypothetical protein
MASLCLGLLVLSQGVPFVHAGDDLLRSKSLDRDSYNSGDWFNRIDWTGATNGFGSGLPVSTKNGARRGGSWPLPHLRPAGTCAQTVLTGHPGAVSPLLCAVPPQAARGTTWARCCAPPTPSGPRSSRCSRARGSSRC